MSMDDPIGFGEWVVRHRASLNDHARALGGDEDDVARAIQRTLTSESFPANNDNLWRNWAEGAIRSVISTRARGAARAERALEEASAIYTECGGTHTPLRERPEDDPTPGLTASPVQVSHNHYWPGPLEEVIVQPAGRCRRCGAILSLRLEREAGEPYWIEVFGCANGHRQYPEVRS